MYRVLLAEKDQDILHQGQQNPVEVTVTQLKKQVQELTNELMNDIYGTMERGFGSIYKAVRLPPHINPHAITANYKDGVLTVVIPKPETLPEDSKEITIPIEYEASNIGLEKIKYYNK